MTLHELHAMLQRAFDELHAVRGNAPVGTSSDTAFMVGRALGAVETAKDLVARDIDQGAGP